MIEQKYSDTLPLRAKELAENMRVCAKTVTSWKRRGYAFEFGHLTTTAHLKNWLRNLYHEDDQAFELGHVS